MGLVQVIAHRFYFKHIAVPNTWIVKMCCFFSRVEHVLYAYVHYLEIIVYLRGTGSLDNYVVKIQRAKSKNVVDVLFRILYEYKCIAIKQLSIFEKWLSAMFLNVSTKCIMLKYFEYATIGRFFKIDWFVSQWIFNTFCTVGSLF